MSRPPSPDALFQDAEQLASDFSLFPRSSNPSVPQNLEGLVSEEQVRKRLRELRRLAVDEYVSETVAPAEALNRPGIRAVLKRLGWQVHREVSFGPLYTGDVVLQIGGEERRVGLLAQDRSHQNGAWMPEHHQRAVQVVRSWALQLMPIVTFIDTPGAIADDEANRGNQAHSISRLIAEMAQLHVPTIGIIFGNGYSGGAIPLATTNIILSVVDGVFNTIQPRGLASIARKYNLSWQECAKAVGVSAYELYEQGYLDGIVDYSPLWNEHGIENFEKAICSSIAAIEDLARHFAGSNTAVFEHYQRTVQRYLDAPDRHRPRDPRHVLSTIDNPTQQPNIYGVSYRYLRYLGLRRRVSSTTAEAYGRLSTNEIPSGDLGKRIARDHHEAFERWVSNPLKIKYDDTLSGAWQKFNDRREALGYDRGAVSAFLFGTRQANFETARSRLLLEVGFYLYNLWKSGAPSNLALLMDHLKAQSPSALRADGDLDVLDVLLDPDLHDDLESECRQLVAFDAVYDQLIAELKSVAFEAMDTNRISRASVGTLLGAALDKALQPATINPMPAARPDGEGAASDFDRWIRRLVAYRRRGKLLQSVAHWKKAAFPTVSEPLFGLITFFFDHLLPSYYDAEHGGSYDGRIRPRNIGIKDFWNRLDRAYKDLLIQEVLIDAKRGEPVTPERILEAFFTDTEELDQTMMTADPVTFPGFRISIEHALDRGVVPCGTVTAVATFTHTGTTHRVGVMVSNIGFQAGSFDMASGVKLCRLLLRCADERLPVICYISSGGMQTKEGAGSLFSMAIINDRLTRFMRENDLPVLVFGFGDCTGGAQASLVTHPLVDTFYFSGASMPFAGQIVVPSHLPMTSTLSNYLSDVPDAMAGLVKHPFAADLDERLRLIDPDIPLPTESVADTINSVLTGREHHRPETTSRAEPKRTRKLFQPVSKVLVHARGCTAVKLIAGAHDSGVDVVLVQSDPDMESVATRLLGKSDALVCLGGSTPDESYLNAHSVIRIAESEGCDAIHPGIGFLSESSAFAALCARHQINFIGPNETSMERVGNKSNAVQTARRLGIPVVPGSHGVVTSPASAVDIANDIGFPIVLKAVHGGGGRGIEIVRDSTQLEDIFLRMGAEAHSAFGSRDLYLEKLIERFRHVEIQILRDRHGHTKVLGLRDCSVQRNQQKVIEESGSTLLSDKLRAAAFDHARGLVDDVGYVGAGTVEFIFDLEAQRVYFMEVNARLQVEHPVTEAVTGINIVQEQFRIATGDSIEELDVTEQGYAIELRVNAERIAYEVETGLRIAPDPGTVSKCSFPENDSVDVVAAIEQGSVVSPFYDNLLAQVVARGKNRAATIKTLLAWLAEVQIEGIGSNLPLLRLILEDEEFVAGTHDTGYVGRLLERANVDELVGQVEALRGPRSTLDRASVAIEGSDELKVVARGPCVFYAAPGPGRAEFVSIGDRVHVDTTLCLIEAMKLFEKLSLGRYNAEGLVYTTDTEYEIVRINAHNGQLVTEGDLLFVVRPIQAG